MYINKTNTLCYTTTINWYIRGGRRRDQRTAEKTCENEKHAKPSRTALSCYHPPPPQDEIPLNKIHHSPQMSHLLSFTTIQLLSVKLLR